MNVRKDLEQKFEEVKETYENILKSTTSDTVKFVLTNDLRMLETEKEHSLAMISSLDKCIEIAEKEGSDEEKLKEFKAKREESAREDIARLDRKVIGKLNFAQAIVGGEELKRERGLGK